MKKLLSLVLAALFCLSACALAEETPVTVKVGVVGSALAKEGINIELVEFSDYVMPNIALASGDIDLNAFQHYNFLENWNDENAETYGTRLVPIGETLIAPLSMYSDKYASVDEIQEGDTILVMNDVVNEARALNMLDTLGLVKLGDNLTSYATVADIVENPLNLNIVELDAAMVGSQMSDSSVAADFMNGQYATQAGYKHEDAIAVEAFDPDNADQHGIVNIIAAREADAENPVYLRIAEAYQCDEVKEVFDTLYAGSFKAAW
mgnify:CR=1 FL=1